VTSLLPAARRSGQGVQGAESAAGSNGPLVWQRRLLRKLVVLDVLAAATASFGTLRLRYDGSRVALNGIDYRLLALTVPVVWVAVLGLSGAYEKRILGAGSEEFRRVANASVRMLAAFVVVGFALKVDTSRTVLVGSVFGAVTLSVLLRWIARKALHAQRRRGRCGHRTVVVGDVHDVRGLILSLRRVPHAGFEVVGVCIPGEHEVLPDDTVPVLGTPHEAAAVALQIGADTVAVAGSGSLGEHGLRRLAWSLEGCPVDLLVAPGLTDVAGPRVAIRPVDGVPLLQVDAPQFTGWRRVVKGAFDRLLATLFLGVLALPLAAVAVAVRLTSDGPAFYCQTRVGRGGRTFRIWKFRTMHVGADTMQQRFDHNDADGVLFKLRSDPRVTPIGRVLRRWSIDELPQLWNVLRGDMSLVGPRPPVPSEVERYADHVHRRLLVKPGMTGLWQVSGRSNLPWEECVRLDLRYVENWSVTLDLVILARTLTAVVRADGAY
jgi:exopolysaccharide biosynthesis polyprenyl glycosylphosphotransferase